MNLSDNFIIKKCIKKNAKYQEILFQKYYGKIMGVCLRYSSDESQAKDFLQESFIKIFNNIEKYKGSGSFESWIKKITRNHIIDYIRKNKTIYISIKDDNQIWDDRDCDSETDSFLQNIKAKDIIDELQNLPTSQRTVFNLYVVDGISHKEISKTLNITIGTSKSNLHKAKKNLKKRLLNKYKVSSSY